MKPRFILATFLALVLVPLCSAQVLYSVQSFIDGGTNNVAAATTNSYTHNIDVRKQDNACLQISFAMVDTSTTTIDLVLLKSLDASTWDTVDLKTITLTADGTNTVCCVTNLSTAGLGWYRLSTIANTSAVALTNLSFSYAIKRAF